MFCTVNESYAGKSVSPTFGITRAQAKQIRLESSLYSEPIRTQDRSRADRKSIHEQLVIAMWCVSHGVLAALWATVTHRTNVGVEKLTPAVSFRAPATRKSRRRCCSSDTRTLSIALAAIKTRAHKYHSTPYTLFASAP